MNTYRTTLPRKGIYLLFAIMAALALVAAPADAADLPVVAGLSVTPGHTGVGTGAQVVGTATNTTNGAVTAALGVDLSGALASTNVSGSRCTPRHLSTLIYCAVSLPAHASATITFTATAHSAGTYAFRTYARILYATDNSFAYATLTVT